MEADLLKAWYAHAAECVICHLALINCADADDRSAYCEQGVELALKMLREDT